MIEILILAFGAVGVGFFLILLLGVADKNSRNRRAAASPDTEGLTQIQFEKVCVALTEAMKLEIENIERSDGTTLGIRAKNPTPFVGGDFFVHCAYLSPQTPQEKVSAAEIIELSNMIIQDRLSKGIFITNSEFTEDLSSISELAPIEFIDGKKLHELMQKYSIVPAAL
jgi:hypothetical protein